MENISDYIFPITSDLFVEFDLRALLVYFEGGYLLVRLLDTLSLYLPCLFIPIEV